MPRIQSPQRVLAIAGGAFLIGTVQAVLFGPVTLGPANITAGTEGVKGDPSRARPSMPNDPQSLIEDANPLKDAAQDAISDDISGDAPDGFNTTPPTAAYTGASTDASDALLDAPVPNGTLTLRESYSLWEQGAYFIDARHEYEFDAGHIQYAAFLPAQMFDADSQRAYGVMDSIPQDATIVLYCVGGECDASKNTAAMLEQFGYTDLRIMGAGYEHWVAAGFPIEVTDTANTAHDTTGDTTGGAP